MKLKLLRLLYNILRILNRMLPEKKSGSAYQPYDSVDEIEGYNIEYNISLN